jgi:succinate dehydrogenase/fumarate reductase cytochrome b subunit
MASPRELPDMIGEFFALAKQYLKDSILEPARALGRLAAMSFAGSVIFVLAALFLGVAGMRLIVSVMPDGMIWSGVGYMAASLALLATTGLVMWRATR